MVGIVIVITVYIQCTFWHCECDWIVGQCFSIDSGCDLVLGSGSSGHFGKRQDATSADIALTNQCNMHDTHQGNMHEPHEDNNISTQCNMHV